MPSHTVKITVNKLFVTIHKSFLKCHTKQKLAPWPTIYDLPSMNISEEAVARWTLLDVSWYYFHLTNSWISHSWWWSDDTFIPRLNRWYPQMHLARKSCQLDDSQSVPKGTGNKVCISVLQLFLFHGCHFHNESLLQNKL